MKVITNPILKGFNPDPSIVKAGNDFYIATSTFEWFPGVQIHHSTDLRNWKLIARPLNRTSQLDLKGIPDSCGIWAPCLTYHDERFYLIYSNVKSFAGVWKDTPTYLVTAKHILGPWSNPVFLSSSGFDASLFHDDDGRKWFLSVCVDHRKGSMFGGILLQEYDAEKQSLTGPIYHIFSGSELGRTEGPHLYKKDGYYYLLTAEGGTEYNHAATMARSRAITGPYELAPGKSFISSRSEENHYLQKCGHADLVQLNGKNWAAVFLTARPLTTRGLCILGRETAIETVLWPENEWPMLGSGNSLPRTAVPLNNHFPVSDEPDPVSYTDHFDEDKPDIQFQSLRVPMTEDWITLKKRRGFLTLYGRESLSSLHEQSLIARRIQNLRMDASTALDFQPWSFQQMAGLICYYNTAHFHYLHLSSNERGYRCLQIISFDHFEQTEAFDEPIELPHTGTVLLKASLNGASLQFYYAVSGQEWIKAGPVLNAGILSDDYVREKGVRYQPAFTGAFVGLCCQDLTGNKIPAYFDWFNYTEGDYSFSSR